MKLRTPYALPVAALVALAAGCSHAQTPAERTRAAADRSQQAFQQAADDQKKLEEQQKRIDAAHAQVVKDQKALADAQRREEQERMKAQQLQQLANQHLEQATQQASQARMAATAGEAQGLQTIAGNVAEASPNRVVLQTPGGRTMSFRVDDRTQVLVGSEQRSAGDIQQGADARVAYELSGGQPTALTIQVTPLGSEQPNAQQPNAPPAGSGLPNQATPVGQ